MCSYLKGLNEKLFDISDLAKARNGLKQKCTQFLTPFSGIFPCKHGMICRALRLRKTNGTKWVRDNTSHMIIQG